MQLPLQVSIVFVSLTISRASVQDKYQGWGFDPLIKPPVPGVANTSWARNEVDALILAGLSEARIAPSPETDRRTLFRRLAYDLTGLPPSPEEVEKFIADEDPGAYSRIVESLLSSPQYGVRWGRHWLDLVRYAETNGYERDSNKPHIWRYRDYVIDAFNQDKPYDQFIIEQIAGDELDEVTPDSIIATGFLRLGLWDDEPPMGIEQARYDALDDICRTSAEAFLALTIGCARCHDHKGDPIPTTDYYSFMSFFHGLTNPSVGGTLVQAMSAKEKAAHQQVVEDHEAEKTRVAQEMHSIEQEYARSVGAAITGLTNVKYRFYRDSWSELPDFDELRPEDVGTLEGGRFSLAPATRPDSYGFVFEGDLIIPAAGEYRFHLRADDAARLSVDGIDILGVGPGSKVENADGGLVELQAGTVSLRLDYLQRGGRAFLDLTWGPARDQQWRYSFEDPGSGWFGSGYDDSGWKSGPAGFGADVPHADVKTTWNTPDIWLRREFTWDSKSTGDFSMLLQHDDDVEVYLNGVLALRRGGSRGDYAAFPASPEALATLKEGTNQLALHCRQGGGGQYIHVQPVHIAELAGASLKEVAFGRHGLSESGAEPGSRVLAETLIQQGQEMLGSEEHARYVKLKEERAQLERSKPVPPRLAYAATEKGNRAEDLHVHERGNPAVRGALVAPAFPSIFAPPAPTLRAPPEGARTSYRRRVLAEWIASTQNPRTARVMVNRVWQHHFGRGIVPTANDFGALGEPPSHPELLDWLATEFADSGWSVKALHRIIVHSSTYRQGYRLDERAAEVDPANKLYWRFPARRLGAEEVRDSIIAMTGQLNLALGGPGFFSRIPKEALATSSRPGGVWGRSSDEEVRRRSAYIKVKRSLQTPLLAAFDMPDTDLPCAARFATTQPAQALSLLNSEFMETHAGGFARALAAQRPGDAREQIARGVEIALQRRATAAELEDLLQFHAELRSEFACGEFEAMRYICTLILNLNEFIYLD